ncbi:hypothetical protein Tco_0057325, partial [Tanacetum coccineum]
MASLPSVDEEILTDELSNLEEVDLSEDNEIAEVFRIETDVFLLETPLSKEFKEFNHLLQIDVDVLTRDLPRFNTYEDYKNAWIYEWNIEVSWVEEKPWLDDGTWREPNDEWEHNEDTTYIKSDVNYNHNTYNIVCQTFLDHAGINNDDDAIQASQRFNDYELMEDDDDIGDLDDCLIPNNASYYVNEEEERFKERNSKLLGIPYEKPPTFKSKKFKVIKYSLGPAEEYVAIKEYEYDIWVRTDENVSR